MSSLALCSWTNKSDTEWPSAATLGSQPLSRTLPWNSVQAGFEMEIFFSLLKQLL